MCACEERNEFKWRFLRLEVPFTSSRRARWQGAFLREFMALIVNEFDYNVLGGVDKKRENEKGSFHSLSRCE